MAGSEIKYVDTRPIYLPKLSHYPDGVALPNKTNIITVSEREKRHLLKIKNGVKPSFEEIRQPRRERETVKEA